MAQPRDLLVRRTQQELFGFHAYLILDPFQHEPIESAVGPIAMAGAAPPRFAKTWIKTQFSSRAFCVLRVQFERLVLRIGMIGDLAKIAHVICWPQTGQGMK
ncbi:hypothetical protein [Mesorhizobium sp. L103C131B0]|uniref:hypothetical protein n=1 Tax=Mesorhizobium sp. L103C131B0 TaxID=1287089 RepID=UPI0012DD329B|nr:hypothetical protein [Mesorhizobium sp. L103C131B0]